MIEASPQDPNLLVAKRELLAQPVDLGGLGGSRVGAVVEAGADLEQGEALEADGREQRLLGKAGPAARQRDGQASGHGRRIGHLAQAINRVARRRGPSFPAPVTLPRAEPASRRARALPAGEHAVEGTRRAKRDGPDRAEPQPGEHLESGKNTVQNPHYAGNAMPDNLPEDNFVFFYHPDHLGSTEYVTDYTGELYEHVQYFAFGETWVSEHKNTERVAGRAGRRAGSGASIGVRLRRPGAGIQTGPGSDPRQARPAAA